MRIFSIGLLIVGVAAIAVTSWRQTARDDRDIVASVVAARPAEFITQGSPPATTATGAGGDAERSRRVARLTDEVVALRAELARLRASLPLEESPPDKAARVPAEHEDLEIDRTETEAHFERMDARLHSEPADPAWAPRAAAEIERAVLETTGSTLQALRCGSTMCRAVIDHGPTVNLAAFELTFLESVGRSLPRNAMQHSGFDSGVNGGATQSIVYLARAGYRLAPPDRG